MNDIMTIVWKELKELWHASGGLRARLLSHLSILFVFGVFIPLQERNTWTQGPLAGGVLFFLLMPVVFAGSWVADSFAGERERRTLETLLATRLSDRDIFLGKVLATMIYSVGLVWSCALLSLITLNATRGSRPIYIYNAPTLAVLVIGCVLLSLLTTAIGLLISLRAASARAAAQVFSMVILVLFLGVPFLLQVLPNSAKAWIVRTLSTGNATVIGIAAALTVFVIDISLLALGVVRFQRQRLILE